MAELFLGASDLGFSDSHRCIRQTLDGFLIWPAAGFVYIHVLATRGTTSAFQRGPLLL